MYHITRGRNEINRVMDDRAYRRTFFINSQPPFAVLLLRRYEVCPGQVVPVQMPGMQLQREKKGNTQSHF